MSWLIVVLLLGTGALACAGIAWLVSRFTYRGELRRQGWRFLPEAPADVAYGFNAPPFGVGLGRRTGAAVTGRTASGAEVRVIEYSLANPVWEQRCACLALPHPVPELYVSRTREARPGSAGVEVGRIGDLVVRCADPALGAAFVAQAAPAIQDMARRGFHVDLGTDGAWLVAAHAPQPAARLHQMVRALEPVAAVLGGSGFADPAPLPVPAELSVHGRPSWIYRLRDDALLQHVPVTWEGSGHTATNCLFADNDGLPVLALQHHWTTGTSSDVRHHVETPCEIRVPFTFPNLSINGGHVGPVCEVSDDPAFRERYRVRAANARFAAELFHPGMVAFVRSFGAPAFTLENGLLRVHLDGYDPDAVVHAADFAHGLFRRVPAALWQGLGGAPDIEWRNV